MEYSNGEIERIKEEAKHQQTINIASKLTHMSQKVARDVFYESIDIFLYTMREEYEFDRYQLLDLYNKLTATYQMIESGKLTKTEIEAKIKGV